MKIELLNKIKVATAEWKTILAITLPTFLILLYLILKNTHIGFLGLYSIDEYVFHGSIRHMFESLLSGNLSGLFGYGFYQYGFVYFFINLVAAAPGLFTDNFTWAIAAPRLISSFFAIGSLLFIYKFSRLYMEQTVAILITLFIVTMPAFWYNATWFHPDWPMTFFLIACIYYLAKDSWNFGKYFKFAVAAYGLALAFKYQALTALPVIGLYIFYDHIRTFQLAGLTVSLKRLVYSLATAVAIFVLMNPYILHPLGWRAFSGAFLINMMSNATNHGSAIAVTLSDKLTYAIGDYYLNIIFLFITLLATLWLTKLFFKSTEKNIFVIIAVNFIVNLGYLLFFVNKAWQIYYLPVMTVGLLSLIFFLQYFSTYHQKLIVGFVCIVQLLTYGTSYSEILTQSRDESTPDYTTYTEEQNIALDVFVIENLKGTVTSESNILITPYTPFSFDKINLKYEQVKLIFGALNRGSIDVKAYLEGQKSYWGNLKSEEELLSSFVSTDIIILRKNIPFIASETFNNFNDKAAYMEAQQIIKELYDGGLGYTVLAENDLVVIFVLKPDND